MKKLILTLTLLLGAGLATAQPMGDRVRTDSNGITVTTADDGRWLSSIGNGVPTFTTFLSESVPAGATYINTATGILYYFSGTSWSAGASGSTSFSGLTTGTNTTAAMTVDTGASLITTGGSALLRDATTWIRGSSDITKRGRFEVDGFTAANDLVFTLPGTVAATRTLAVLELAQTFTGAATFSASAPSATMTNEFVAAKAMYFGSFGLTNGALINGSLMSLAGPVFATGSTSESVRFMQGPDSAVNMGNGPCGSSPCINPHAIWHDKDQNTTNYQAVGLPGLSGKFVVTLTESTPTNVLVVPVADNESVAGTVQTKVFASDGSVHQARSALLRYVATNEGGTERCVIGTAAGGVATNETDDGNLSDIASGTLTTAWTFTAGTATCILAVDAVSSLTQTALSFEAQNFHVGTGEPLPQ